MEPINIPLVPQWCIISACVSTPDDGLLYIGWETVIYISKIEFNKTPVMKVFHIRQKIKCLDCDPDWSETKYFVILAEDNSVQIWDFIEDKAKKGHNAHIKQVLGDDELHSLDVVKLCFLKNRKVLSIDSGSIVIYCPSSNTYTKTKRILPLKHEISIIKGSPYDENIVAIGTVRGLILIVDLKNENILYTLRGHDTEITSLSWMAINFNKQLNQNNAISGRLFKKSDPGSAINDSNHILNNSSGHSKKECIEVPNDNTNGKTDNIVDYGAKTNDDLMKIENLKFLEECRNLRHELFHLEIQPDGNVVNDSVVESPLSLCEQVNECSQLSMENCNSGSTTVSCVSPQSADVIDGSTSKEDIRNHDKNDDTDDQDDGEQNACMGISSSQQNFHDMDIFLASGSYEPIAWIWNTKSGSAVQSLKLKSSSQNSKITVCWINETTLITNTRSGEIILWKCENFNPLKLNIYQEKRIFNHRGVTALCKLKNSDVIWTLSTYREIICEDITEGGKVLAKYSCASTNISAIRECPENMNRLAFASGDRRIGIIDLSNLTPTNVAIENWSNKIDSTVLSLSWSESGKYIAFGTNEGRIGVYDIEKPSAPAILFHPFSGKPVYSIQWCGKQIFVCSNEKVAIYEWNVKSKDPIILQNITEASAIYAKPHHLLVGTQNGFLNIFKRDDENCLDFEKITSVYVAPKYISEISFNLINPNKFAISSLANKIIIFTISYETDVLISERVLMMNDSCGNAWVKWSNLNDYLLLSCGFDGAIRVWDLSLKTNNELIFLKQYLSPMLCGIFSPINENVIICAGKLTSLEMFDRTKEKSTSFNKLIWKKKNKATIGGGIQWATRIRNDQENSKNNKDKNRLRKKRQKVTSDEEGGGGGGGVVVGDCDNMINNGIVENLHKLELDENGSDDLLHCDNLTKESLTILHLTNKEIHKDALECLLTILQEGYSNNTDVTNQQKKKVILSLKMFGSRSDVQSLLHEELRNHQTSNTKSVAHILIPQLGDTLKDEILEMIRTKKLTAQHVALSPFISYRFWRHCCIAYANQLIEMGLILQATPYLLACHKVKDCIEELVTRKYFREAWILAKIHREHDDPILKFVLDNWIEYLSTNGNLESAALICALSNRYEQCRNILLRRRQITEEHKKILGILNKRLEN